MKKSKKTKLNETITYKKKEIEMLFKTGILASSVWFSILPSAASVGFQSCPQISAGLKATESLPAEYAIVEASAVVTVVNSLYIRVAVGCSQVQPRLGSRVRAVQVFMHVRGRKIATSVVCNEDKVNPIHFRWKWGEAEFCESPIVDQYYTYLGVRISKYCSGDTHI